MATLHGLPCLGLKDDEGGLGAGREAENTYGLPAGLPIRRRLLHWFRRQLRRVLGTLSEIGVGIPLFFPALSDYDDPMTSAMTPIIGSYWDRAGKAVRARLGLDPREWRVTDPHLRDKIRGAAYDFCRATNASTSMGLNDALDKLRQEMAEGQVEQGEALPKLRKRVAGVFDLAAKYRSQRIAATEASRASHAAGYQSAVESGVVVGVKWLLSGDACELCHLIANEVGSIPLGGRFAVIGDNPTYQDIRHPPAHPNCRCSMTYVLSPKYGGPQDPEFGSTLVQPKV